MSMLEINRKVPFIYLTFEEYGTIPSKEDAYDIAKEHKDFQSTQDYLVATITDPNMAGVIIGYQLYAVRGVKD